MPHHPNFLQLLEQFAQKFVYNLLKQKRERPNNGIFFGLGCLLSVPQESHLRMKNQYNCFKLSKRFSYSGPFFPRIQASLNFCCYTWHLTMNAILLKVKAEKFLENLSIMAPAPENFCYHFGISLKKRWEQI